MKFVPALLTLSVLTSILALSACSASSQESSSSSTAGTTTSLPSAPTSPAFQQVTASNAQLVWEPAAQADGYYIYSLNISNLALTRIAVCQTTNALITNLANQSNYYFYVSSYNSSGESSKSSFAVLTAGDRFTYSLSSNFTVITGLTAIGKTTASLYLPPEIEGKPVTVIESNAFTNCTNLVRFYMPHTVLRLGYYAFRLCSSLSNITWSTNLQIIEDSAFYNCYVLQQADVPETLTNIGNSAFNNCRSLKNITLSSRLTCLSSFVFSSCTSLSNITIPNSITNINTNAFYYCTNLSSVTLPTNLTSVGYGAFVNCTGLTHASLPSTITNIPIFAFANSTRLTSITIAATNPPALDMSAFTNCPLGSILVPSNSVLLYQKAAKWSNYSNIIQAM